jgi:hypothetical protein
METRVPSDAAPERPARSRHRMLALAGALGAATSFTAFGAARVFTANAGTGRLAEALGEFPPSTTAPIRVTAAIRAWRSCGTRCSSISG